MRLDWALGGSPRLEDFEQEGPSSQLQTWGLGFLIAGNVEHPDLQLADPSLDLIGQARWGKFACWPGLELDAKQRFVGLDGQVAREDHAF